VIRLERFPFIRIRCRFSHGIVRIDDTYDRSIRKLEGRHINKMNRNLGTTTFIMKYLIEMSNDSKYVE